MFRRHPTQTITDTINGTDITYNIPAPAPPQLPFNLDALLRRTLFTAALAMTIGAIIWGTVAIGSMLTHLAPAWAAYLVAGAFDAGWAACLAAEWILRYDHKRAATPRHAGIAMLVVSMAAIIVHGALAGPWGWAIGIIGALVSAAAKGVWAIGMHTIRIKLDPKYEAYLRTLQQQAGTEQALALGERDRMQASHKTAQLRLALEARRPGGTTVDQIVDHAGSAPVQGVDQRVDQIETIPEPAPVHAVQTGPVRADRPVQPEDQVAVLLSHLRSGDHLTKQDAADILGIPPTTAHRRLTAAKDQLRQYN